MASKMSIVNQALALLGQDPTETLVLQDAKAPTRRLLVFVDQALDEVLTYHHWTEATRHPQLTAVADVDGDTDWRYPYVYKLPPSVLRVLGVEGCYPWQVATRANSGAEERVIRSADPGPLKLTCIVRIDYASVPAHLITALATTLAALSCYAVTGDNAKADGLVKAAQDRLIMALGKDASQEGGQPPLFEDRFAALRASAS